MNAEPSGFTGNGMPQPKPMPPEPPPGTPEHDIVLWAIVKEIHTDVQSMKRWAWWIGGALSPIVTTALGAGVRWALQRYGIIP
jgi:hypothetical protein